MLTYACPSWEFAADRNCSDCKTESSAPFGNLPRYNPIRNFPYLYDYVRQLCREQASVIHNHDNIVIRTNGQGEAPHWKYKRLKLGGGQTYDRSFVQILLISFGSKWAISIICCTKPDDALWQYRICLDYSQNRVMSPRRSPCQNLTVRQLQSNWLLIVVVTRDGYSIDRIHVRRKRLVMQCFVVRGCENWWNLRKYHVSAWWWLNELQESLRTALDIQRSAVDC